MNYNHEPYPSDLNALTKKVDAIAKEVLKNVEEALLLNELYTNHKNVTRRNVNKFSLAFYQANIYKGKSKLKNRVFNEFKGLYIFFDKDNKPVYVGISRSVYKRLAQHGWGKKHNQCSLAYLMAKDKDKNLSRSEVQNEEHLEPQKVKIRNYKVVLHPVSCNYELYYLEIALAVKLKTYWNSFKTH